MQLTCLIGLLAGTFAISSLAIAEEHVPTLRVGSGLFFQPYAYADSQGRAAGFSIELFDAVARVTGLTPQYFPDDWNDVWQGLTTGTLDAIPMVARLPAREGMAEFTSPHTLGYDTFFVRKDTTKIDTLEEAKPLRIIVMKSDAAHEALRSRGFSQQLVLVDNLAEGFRLLASGQHDALLAPLIQGQILLPSLGLDEAIQHGALLQEYRREYCFATAKGNLALRDKLERGLAQVKASGEYDRLYRKWLGIYEPANVPRTYVYWGAAGFALLLAAALAWSWSLRRQVRAQTAELLRHHVELEEAFDERTQELRESEARFRLLIEQSPDGIFVAGIDGRYCDVNTAGASMLGYTREEILARSISDVIIPEEKIRLPGEVKRVTADAVTRTEWIFRRKDGSTFVGEIMCRALPDGRLQAILRDVTERKQVEAELRLAKEVAESAAEAKGAFLANMSHEIRTPLHIIIGLAHLLTRDEQAPFQKTRLRQLTENSEHLLAVLNDILDLSKADARHLQLNPAPFRLGEVIAKVRRMFQIRAREKGLSLRIDVDAALADAVVVGDAQRLTQVLLNLVGNAIKFTEQGEVVLSVACLAASPEAYDIRFSVRDTGVGIAPADHARIFDAFEQADKSPTRLHQGTGLGLSISRHLVELMGSAIQLDSRLGSGSTFSFDLCLERSSAEIPGQPVEALAPATSGIHPGLHVLLVEDHEMSQEIILEMLTDLGCEADVVPNGLEAVRCVQERHFDLILMDMQMPIMDGLTATRRIRALPGYADTPIIALTANAFAEDREQCLEAGMSGHLPKPVTPQKLADALAGMAPMPSLPPWPDAGDSGIARMLAELEGIEVGPSWRKSPQHLEEYCHNLSRFAALHRQELAQAREAVEGGNLTEASNLVHRLKGIAGLLGATRAHAMSLAIGDALKRGEPTEAIDLIEACDEELTRLEVVAWEILGLAKISDGLTGDAQEQAAAG
jgi:two-component system sensor histidine kinase EvgS